MGRGRPRKNKVVEEEKRQYRHLQTCYVCSHKISGEAVRLGGSIKHPDGLYRHIRCEPGSKRWVRSDIGKKSEHYDLFEKDEI